MKEKGVITNIEQLTPEWLTNIFKKKGYLSNGKVTKIIKRNSQETFTSYVHFLELNFSNDAQTEGASPEIVVKIPKSVDIAKLVGKREVKFYNTMKDFNEELQIPICYDATFSEETSQSHIILDDLSKTHIELSNWPLPLSKRHCELAIEGLAKFHAFWWDRENLEEIISFMNKKIIFSMFEAHEQTLNRILKFLGDRMSDTRRNLYKKVFSLYPQLIWRRISKNKNRTLQHGDAHFWNFFYPKDIENECNEVYLIDWQSWGPGFGTGDLTYMIGLHWFPERRCEMEKELTKRYYNALIKHGVKNYSWDDCWYDYRLFAIGNLYIPIIQCNMKLPPFIWWAHLERACLTFEDLNCMELLEKKNK